MKTALLGVGLGAIIAGVVVWLLCANQRRTERAADEATIAAHVTTIADLKRRSAQIDTVYQRDTVRLVAANRKRDTVFAEARVDTFRVSVPVEVVREVLRADSAVIEACSSALQTCEQQQATLRSIIAADSTALRAKSRELARAKVRSRFSCTVGPSYSLNGGPSYAGVSCGLRVF